MGANNQCRQRPAIEGLDYALNPLPPEGMEAHSMVFVDGLQMHVLGISRGVGSNCSIPDMNVIVVGQGQCINPNPWTVPASECKYVVLQRMLTPEEKAAERYGNDGLALQAVELLNFVERDEDGRLHFELTGEVKTYINA